MKVLGATWVMILAALGSSVQAFALSESSADVESHTSTVQAPVGIGSLLGRSSDHSEYALVIEGQNHFKQRRGMFAFNQYGHGQSRLELGTGLGVLLTATSGITVEGLKAGQSFAPHFGIEPLSGRIAFSTNSNRERYYEWIPMASLGMQVGFFANSCRLLPLVRAGGALGNMGKSGWLPAPRLAVGAGSYLNCASIDVAAEVTRLIGSGAEINLAVVDMAYAVQPNGFKVGLRGESDLSRGGGVDSPDRTEQRILLLLRGALTSFE